eukprot:scaffold10399_cov113-Cylindrotheca_fusiformis.AAC.11
MRLLSSNCFLCPLWWDAATLDRKVEFREDGFGIYAHHSLRENSLTQREATGNRDNIASWRIVLS